MSYAELLDIFTRAGELEESTVMKSPCLGYRGGFMTMMSERVNALIIKVSPNRAEELIAEGRGLKFNFTKKNSKEWVLFPLDYESMNMIL